MRYFFVTAVQKLRALDSLGGDLNIAENLFLTADKKILESILRIKSLGAMGAGEAQFLRESPLLIYGKWETSSEEFLPAPIVELNKHLDHVFAFFDSLWFVKDNAVTAELCFLVEFSLSAPGVRVSSNALARKDCMADLSDGDCGFKKAEIKEAVKLLAPFEIVALDPNNGGIELELQVHQSRFGRAHHFLQAARADSSILLRIAQCCSALEALFASDSMEIAHKLAERVAVFLGSTSGERIALFKKVKAAYQIRSKVVHGAKIGSARAELVEASMFLDEILRNIFRKILTEADAKALFSLANENFDQYFLEKMLGTTSRPAAK